MTPKIDRTQWKQGAVVIFSLGRLEALANHVAKVSRKMFEAPEFFCYAIADRLRGRPGGRRSPLKPRKPRMALRGLDSHFQNWG